NPPRWPEVAEIVKTILYAYKDNARDWERMGEWIERIGWPRFFELIDLPFTRHHIDDFHGGRHTLNASAHIHF
ncbi:MAG: dissimilatory-type sulfite reductase subunit beta, partial [Alphaproteobacteria bacterium]|nr:dissimilatory-type sulfite reductase subunit beta [Alphaproteobacteria bacterium]